MKTILLYNMEYSKCQQEDHSDFRVEIKTACYEYLVRPPFQIQLPSGILEPVWFQMHPDCLGCFLMRQWLLFSFRVQLVFPCMCSPTSCATLQRKNKNSRLIVAPRRTRIYYLERELKSCRASAVLKLPFKVRVCLCVTVFRRNGL